jgi:hypothetical protein
MISQCHFTDLWFISTLLPTLLILKKIKVGLYIHHAVCVSLLTFERLNESL